MYTPQPFSETRPDTLFDFLEQNPFAILVSGAEAVTASHLPFLIERQPAPNGRLIGHMARANSQWQTIDGRSVLTIFSGPHAYVSPRWYEEPGFVPTWNYVAVHVTGTLHVINEATETRSVLERYVRQFEAGMDDSWSMDELDPPFVDRLIEQIVAFSIDIESMEGKWKLSQNHSTARRERLAHHLVGQAAPGAQAIGRLVQESLQQENQQ